MNSIVLFCFIFLIGHTVYENDPNKPNTVQQFCIVPSMCNVFIPTLARDIIWYNENKKTETKRQNLSYIVLHISFFFQ